MQRWAIITPYGPGIAHGETRAEAIQDAVHTYGIDVDEVSGIKSLDQLETERILDRLKRKGILQ